MTVNHLLQKKRGMGMSRCLDFFVVCNLKPVWPQCDTDFKGTHSKPWPQWLCWAQRGHWPRNHGYLWCQISVYRATPTNTCRPLAPTRHPPHVGQMEVNGLKSPTLPCRSKAITCFTKTSLGSVWVHVLDTGCTNKLEKCFSEEKKTKQKKL